MARRNETNAENLLTDELIMAVLRPAPADAIARFAHDVCGVGDLGRVRWVATQVERFKDLDSERALVVGIAPLPGSKPGDRNLSGKAIPDAVICADGTSIVLEHKVKGVCERSQLIRHALHWALAVDRDEPLWPSAAPPPGYRTSTWGDVRAWALRERTHGDVDVRSLDRLIARLDTTVPASVRTQWQPARPVAVHPRPEPVSLAAIQHAWDLGVLYRETARFIDRHPVPAQECVPDTHRMASAFHRTDTSPPFGLRVFHPRHAMTPLRSLTALYEGTNRPDVWQAAWTGWWNRTLARGADQAVLAAMLAWGQRQNGVKRAHIVENVPLVWNLAPALAPGLERFHAAVAPARLS